MTPSQRLQLLRVLHDLEAILQQHVRNQNLIDGMKLKCP